MDMLLLLIFIYNLYVLCRSVVSDPLGPVYCSPPGSSVHGIFLGWNTGVGCYFLLQCNICMCILFATICKSKTPYTLGPLFLLP